MDDRGRSGSAGTESAKASAPPSYAEAVNTCSHGNPPAYSPPLPWGASGQAGEVLPGTVRPPDPHPPHHGIIYPQTQALGNVLVGVQPVRGDPWRDSIKPPNYMAFSLMTMLCCCWLCGIVALVYSLKVDSLWHHGDIEGARRSSLCSKRWNVAAVVSGVLIGIISSISFSLRSANFGSDDSQT